MSTDNRGRSRTNRFKAMPPLSTRRSLRSRWLRRASNNRLQGNGLRKWPHGHFPDTSNRGILVGILSGWVMPVRVRTSDYSIGVRPAPEARRTAAGSVFLPGAPSVLIRTYSTGSPVISAAPSRRPKPTSPSTGSCRRYACCIAICCCPVRMASPTSDFWKS